MDNARSGHFRKLKIDDGLINDVISETDRHHCQVYLISIYNKYKSLTDNKHWHHVACIYYSIDMYDIQFYSYYING